MNIFKLNNTKDVFDINKLSKQFLDYIDVAPKTIETYKIALKQFTKYMTENNIKNPTRKDIISYRESIKKYLKSTTVNSYLIAIRNFFKYLEYEGIYKNITDNIRGIRQEQRHLKRALTSEEIKEILKNCNIREKVLIELMATCGLRESEIIHIKLEDFYKENDCILLKIRGKGRQEIKSDIVKVDDRVFEDIKTYIKENNCVDYLFTSNCNRTLKCQMSTRGIRQIITDLFKKSNIDMNLVTPHSIRHFSATQSIKNGIDLFEVSEMMRHSSINTTQIYIDERKKTDSLFANKLTDSIL